ncbi:alkaline phosphatase [bacterium AH-315-K20]|nr:alkaline phosphatase [bacterium AH-315-K20]
MILHPDPARRPEGEPMSRSASLSRNPQRAVAALLLLAACAAVAGGQPEQSQPKNIIVFIADGCGESTQRALELWRGEPMIYQGPEWTRFDATTYPLRPGPRPSRGVPPLEQDQRFVYDYALATDTTPDEGSSLGYPFHFRSYRWLRATASDSANTATSIFAGVSTYRGAINVDGGQQAVPTVSKAASERGKAVGIVTSVPFSHATPACAAGASVPKREMYHDITHQMLTGTVCTVIAGAGHPEYDDNAKRREMPKYTYISEGDWNTLKAGTVAGATSPAWTLVDDTERVRALAEGDTPERLFILAPVAHTLQQMRTPHVRRDSTPPGGHPLIPGVPTLRELTLAALNVLDNDPDGFFLMVEGGAVDWAMHDT